MISLRKLLYIIKNNKSLHHSPLDNQPGIVLQSIILILVLVISIKTVIRYCPAWHYSAFIFDVHQNIIEYFTPNIVKVNVNSMSEILSQFVLDWLFFVVDDIVSTKTLDEVAFLLPTGNPAYDTAFELSILDCKVTSTASSCWYDDDFLLFDLSDFFEAEDSSGPRNC